MATVETHLPTTYIQKFGRTEVYKKNWSWSSDTDRWLSTLSKGKFTLNFPCGKSRVGDVRADIDPEVKPDIICSLDFPPFADGSFDLLICDPPFSKFNKFRWILKLHNLTKSEMIFSTPAMIPRFRNYAFTLYATLERGRLFIRNWIIYHKKNQRLDEFCNHEDTTSLIRQPTGKKFIVS